MEQIISQQGEQLSLASILGTKQYKIKIPIIQRDYAQGRPTAGEVRESFLESLYRHLVNDKHLDLDFVYGSVTNGAGADFVPLDGQQQLTTLFLLHWYLANKEGKINDFRELLTSTTGGYRFTYETRPSSTDFCKKLIEQGLDFAQLSSDGDHRVSTFLKNQSWYFLAWKHDPTVGSMLRMIDAIDVKFRAEGPLYNRLVRAEAPVITFQFLPISVFNLGDDLYIKMNSRGKPLTRFENFKARFEEHIAGLTFAGSRQYKLQIGSEKKIVSLPKYFAHKIDGSWTNLFWAQRDPKTNSYDDQLLNLFRVLATNHFARKEQGGNQSVINLLRSKGQVSFLQFLELDCFDADFVEDLVGMLDMWEQQVSFLQDTFFYNEKDIFRNALKNALSYPEAIQFYAYCQYLLRHGADDGLADWMRIIYNLTEYTAYNEATDYQVSLRGVYALLPQSGQIVSWLTGGSIQVTGFLQEQVLEERLKAHLLLKDDKWKAAITLYDRHPYFKGQISFLLHFSGIYEYFIANGHCQWTDAEDRDFFDRMAYYFRKATAVFSDTGLRRYEDFIWERALLTKGDYLLIKGNWSFLVDSDRDIGWKRLLRGDRSVEKRDYVKALFDDPNFDSSNVEHSLQQIIATSQVSDWRYHLIRNPNLIGYCGDRKIKWDQDGQYVMLLGGKIISGPHREMYSYSYYVECLPGQDIRPFTNSHYPPVSTASVTPYMIMDGWHRNGFDYKLSLTYNSDLKGYVLKFEAMGNKDVEPDVSGVLTSHGFAQDELQYLAFLSNEHSVKRTIDNLCSSLLVLTNV